MSTVLVKDFLDTDETWDNIIFELKERCKVEKAEYIAMRIVRDFGYNRQDARIPNLKTEYRMFEDLYEELDDLCQCEDCKNGIQIFYDEVEDAHFFQITGQNFYDKENNYAGTDNVKVYLKEFIW